MLGHLAAEGANGTFELFDLLSDVVDVRLVGIDLQIVAIQNQRLSGRFASRYDCAALYKAPDQAWP